MKGLTGILKKLQTGQTSLLMAHKQILELPDMSINKHCSCEEEDKRGETSVMCCNDCGKPTEDFWKTPNN